MQAAPAAIIAAAVLGGAWLLISAGAGKQGSGAGYVTTENNEGSILDLSALTDQITDAATPAPGDNPQAMSYAGLELLKKREGFSATPYADHKGYSIGYGHLIKPGESLTYVSVDQATGLLMDDVSWAQDAVNTSVTATINQEQFDALCSFCYNVGAGAFARSKLVRRVNAQDPQAVDEFDRWVYASGVVNASLVNRRRSEAAQFESQNA